MATPDQSFKSLVSELIDEISHLIRQELRLAQAETTEKLNQAQNGAISIVVGILLGFVALIVLAQALVIALANIMPAWLAAVIVGVALAIIGFALVKLGQDNLKPTNLVPERTVRTVRGTTQTVMERTP